MNFGKVAFGTLLLAAGALLLAIRLGFVPTDTLAFLLRFWPVLLIAFGLAFLAGALKNPLLGCLASILILGGIAFVALWIAHRRKEGNVSHGAAAIDLGASKVGSLTVRVRTFAGSFGVEGAPAKSRTLAIHVRNFAGDSAGGYRFFASGKTGVFEWPRRLDGLGLAPLGAGVDLQVPEAIPVLFDWRGRFSSMRANLTRLMPVRCRFHAAFSSLRLDLGDAGRPDEIRIGGFLSSARIEIPPDVPVQVVARSTLIMKALPPDFVERARGRGKGRVYAAEGRGRLVKIFVEGDLLHITIERTRGEGVVHGRSRQVEPRVSTDPDRCRSHAASERVRLSSRKYLALLAGAPDRLGSRDDLGGAEGVRGPGIHRRGPGPRNLRSDYGVDKTRLREGSSV